MKADLEELVGERYAEFLEGVDCSDECWPTLSRIDETLDRWQLKGARIEHLGYSRGLRDIRAAVIGDGDLTLLAWGFPHPDEPFGALSLMSMAGAALDDPDLFGNWRLVIVLCPDPDNVALQDWLEKSGTVEDFASSAWRPVHLGLEVDYGFPLQWEVFNQTTSYVGRCRSMDECTENCGNIGACAYKRLPYDTLPESEALADAIERYRPVIVASMHNMHTSGDYTFLLHRESEKVLDGLTALPGIFGRPRHLGDRVDPGKRIRMKDPDLLREQSAQARLRKARRHPRFTPGAKFVGNHSVSMVLETKYEGAQFLVPEVGFFTSPEFADTSPTRTKLRYRTLVALGRGNQRYLHTQVEHDGEWITCAQDKTSARLRGPGKPYERYATRGALGVIAVAERRRALAVADRTWERLDESQMRRHPYMDERALIDVPGSHVANGSLLIFRTRPDYRRRATVAQEATFRFTWPVQTALLLASFRNMLSRQDRTNPDIVNADRELEAVQLEQLSGVPEELRRPSGKTDAVRSQLGRLLLLMWDREMRDDAAPSRSNDAALFGFPSGA